VTSSVTAWNCDISRMNENEKILIEDLKKEKRWNEMFIINFHLQDSPRVKTDATSQLRLLLHFISHNAASDVMHSYWRYKIDYT